MHVLLIVIEGEKHVTQECVQKMSSVVPPKLGTTGIAKRTTKCYLQEGKKGGE